jgi:hypothetical protein
MEEDRRVVVQIRDHQIRGRQGLDSVDDGDVAHLDRLLGLGVEAGLLVGNTPLEEADIVLYLPTTGVNSLIDNALCHRSMQCSIAVDSDCIVAFP